MASGAARAIVECPLEVAKIRRQIGESWKFSGLYKGLSANMARNVPLLSTFFVFIEISKRY
jgi:solute carrier family 25 carnitine/acylcarnitine transporter 20/29